MMNKLIQKFGYKRVKWGVIGITSCLAIIFAITIVFTILTY